MKDINISLFHGIPSILLNDLLNSMESHGISMGYTRSWDNIELFNVHGICD